jgi:hypothetical protein
MEEKIAFFNKFNNICSSFFSSNHFRTTGLRQSFVNNFNALLETLKENKWESDFIEWLHSSALENYIDTPYYIKRKIVENNDELRKYEIKHLPTLLIMHNNKKELLTLLDMGYQLNDKEYALMYIPLLGEEYSTDTFKTNFIPYLENYPDEYKGNLLYNYTKHYVNFPVVGFDYTTLIVHQLFRNTTGDLFLNRRMIMEMINFSKEHYGSPSLFFFISERFSDIFKQYHPLEKRNELHKDIFIHFLSSGHAFSQESLNIIKKEIVYGFYDDNILSKSILPSDTNFKPDSYLKAYNICLEIIDIMNTKNEYKQINSIISSDKTEAKKYRL